MRKFVRYFSTVHYLRTSSRYFFHARLKIVIAVLGIVFIKIYTIQWNNPSMISGSRCSLFSDLKLTSRSQDDEDGEGAVRTSASPPPMRIRSSESDPRKPVSTSQSDFCLTRRTEAHVSTNSLLSQQEQCCAGFGSHHQSKHKAHSNSCHIF